MRFKTITWELVSPPDVPGDNAIGVLTLNVPGHSNALGPRMGLELNHVMDEINTQRNEVIEH